MAADKLRRYELIYLIEPEAEDDTRQTYLKQWLQSHWADDHH